jgi:hypothetical protein
MVTFVSLAKMVDAIGNVVVMMQIYEWAIMINMILFQNGKDISDIMFLINDKKSIDNF